MRIISVAILVLTTLCTTSAHAEQATPDAARTTWLLGTWSCANDEGTTSLWRFVRDSDGSLHLNNQYHTANGGGEFDESFRFDDAKQRWDWTADQHSSLVAREFASARPWTGDSWAFDGSYVTAGLGPPSTIRPSMASRAPTVAGSIHMIYNVTSENSFTRTMDLHGAGMGNQTIVATCRRAST
jgi:hypothetical protein